MTVLYFSIINVLCGVGGDACFAKSSFPVILLNCDLRLILPDQVTFMNINIKKIELFFFKLSIFIFSLKFHPCPARPVFTGQHTV